jgi:ATP-dependent helicase HrpA
VTASERATLYGIVVYSQRRINYGCINPAEAREIFIRDALVAGDYDTRAPFFAHNHKLIKEIENLEHKSRRLDVLVDDQLIAAFYDKQIPPTSSTAPASRSGTRTLARQPEAAVPEPRRADAPRGGRRHHRAVPEDDERHRHRDGAELPLRAGQPARRRDLTVPLFALNQIPRERPAGWCRAC